MRIFLLLLLLSYAYCGIENSVIFSEKNNEFYLAHTSNSMLYKINLNLTDYKIIVGSSNLFGNDNLITDIGTNCLLNKPKSMIINNTETNLYFVDNHNLIKKTTLNSQINNTNNIQCYYVDTITKIDNDLTENVTIFKLRGYNYLLSQKYPNILYFIDRKNIYKINLSTKQINKSNQNLLSNTEYIDIFYFSDTTEIGIAYEFMSNSKKYIWLATVNEDNILDTDILSQNHTIETNVIKYDIIIKDNLAEIRQLSTNYYNTGYSFRSAACIKETNKLIILAENSESKKILIEANIETNKMISISHYNDNLIISNNISMIIDHFSFFGYNDNNYIIGRTNNYNEFVKIQISNFSIIDRFNIKQNVEYNIQYGDNLNLNNTLILYNTLLNREIDNNNTLISIKIDINEIFFELIDFKFKNYNTTNLKFYDNSSTKHTFTNIKNISINSTNTLYIANYSNNISTIYTVNLNNNDYILRNLHSIDEQILTINHIQFENNSELHYISNESYSIYNLTSDTNTKRNNLFNDLTNVNNFVIDTNYEIGYIAFQEKIKWFYL